MRVFEHVYVREHALPFAPKKLPFCFQGLETVCHFQMPIIKKSKELEPAQEWRNRTVVEHACSKM